MHLSMFWYHEIQGQEPAACLQDLQEEYSRLQQHSVQVPEHQFQMSHRKAGRTVQMAVRLLKGFL